MPDFTSISNSISKYTAAVLAAMVRGITLDDLKSNKNQEVDLCLSLFRVELTSEGMQINFKDLTVEEISKLADLMYKGLNINPAMQINFRDLTAEEISKLPDLMNTGLNIDSATSDTSTSGFLISHQQVFRLLFKLGFDGRDVFDFYEAAHIRGSIDLRHPVTGIAYKQYAVVAKLTKDLQEMKSLLFFRTSQFNNDKLNATKVEIDNFWKLVTVDIANFDSISKARAAIYHKLTNVIDNLETLLNDPSFNGAKDKSLHHLIYTDCQAIRTLCLSYKDSIWDQFIVPNAAPNVTASTISTASTTLQVDIPYKDMLPSPPTEKALPSYLVVKTNSAKIKLSTNSGKINPNPITGNAQIGAVITAEALSVTQDINRHLIFIIDGSGSMGELTDPSTEISHAADIVGEAINDLGEKDGFDIFVFADGGYYKMGGLATAHNKSEVLEQNLPKLKKSLFELGRARGDTRLDQIAYLLETDKPVPQGLPLNKYQTIIALLSDGETKAEHAQRKNYRGNRGASSIVRDTFLTQWNLSPNDTRFVAMGMGSDISSEVLEAFADDGDLILLGDGIKDDEYNHKKSEFLAKCKPFTRIEISGTLTDENDQQEYFETTKGRNLEVAYMESVAKIMTKQLPFDVICHVVMPFLQPEKWLCISQGETISRTMKFVIPHAKLLSPVSFWARPRLEGCLVGNYYEMNRVELLDEVDKSLSENVAKYEKAVEITTQEGGVGGVAAAEAIMMRGGRCNK